MAIRCANMLIQLIEILDTGSANDTQVIDELQQDINSLQQALDEYCWDEQAGVWLPRT